MPSPTSIQQRAALLASVTALAFLPGCTAARPARAPAAIPEIAAGAVLEPDAAAARAVLVSPRVVAAAHRLDAGAARAEAAALPPDPSIALSLGVPLDGLGGFPVSVSIMEGLAWLLEADRIRSSAEHERSVAAAELVASTVEVAAEARRLVRVLDAERERARAMERAVAARTALVAIERAAHAAGESSAFRVAAAERRHAESVIEHAAAQRAEREAGAELASLLGLGQAPEVSCAPAAAPQRADPVTTLEVIRARARVARAESMLAASASPFGASSTVGGAVGRDIEDRESIGGTLEIAAPLFRRAHEVAALESDLAAERAELAETERRAALELDHARAQVDAARSMLDSAAEALRAAEVARIAACEAGRAGEASRAAIEEATAESEEWRARAAERRAELANTNYRIESRAAASGATPEGAAR